MVYDEVEILREVETKKTSNLKWEINPDFQFPVIKARLCIKYIHYSTNTHFNPAPPQKKSSENNKPIIEH